MPVYSEVMFHSKPSIYMVNSLVLAFTSHLYHQKNKQMNTSCVPRSPKWAASMWLGCFLRMAVRPRAKESMLAEMALMATWLGPAASWMALWFLPANNGEWDPAGAASGREKVREETKDNEIKVFFGLDVWHECDFQKRSIERVHS